MQDQYLLHSVLRRRNNPDSSRNSSIPLARIRVFGASDQPSGFDSRQPDYQSQGFTFLISMILVPDQGFHSREDTRIIQARPINGALIGFWF